MTPMMRGMAHLSAEDCEAIEEYVRELADALGLRDWLITVSSDSLDENAVIAEIRAVRKDQPHLHLILTGRNVDNALAKMIDEADLVTEMTEIKHPFNAGIFAQQGIEF